MKRRYLLAAAALPWLAHAEKAPLRIAVAPGPQAEVMDLVARLATAQGLALTTILSVGAPAAVNASLASGGFDAASVEDGVAFSNDPSRQWLAEAALTVTLPMALYSRRLAALRDLPVGARVAIPAEPAAATRALLLLYNHGLLLLRPEAGLHARLSDVRQTRRGLRLLSLPSTQLAAALHGTADLAVIDRAHATDAGLQPARDSLGVEDARSPWAGVLTVRRADVEAPWLRQLVAVYRSEPVKRFILDRYQDGVRRPW
ncbi:MetQ/NlpA family ABC transporter substrate-binding protein [Paucibacter sp. R3-3]|uniref:MetQ/NlpA family ABC transporter substrate-binding protein n=1 Tax=Roseateles agri TaxID=3098619 RepID=A0ABU5DHP7_9BURK|nr:MetQ/NlpA family ABC transporter substrate-binding protein [Paucibacter sp. R3-3]MDY0745811.1 MetQ/NlpA family ABC transporter substrate-binding protein [Paucibacter sp. R3-3]